MRRGFTLIELIIVMGLVAALTAMVTLNLTGSRKRVGVATTMEVLAADLRGSQMRAMEGEGAQEIVFGGDRYTLNPEGFVVTLDPEITITSSYAQNKITFAARSGETAGPGTITVTDTSGGATKTLTVNQYGTAWTIAN